MKFDQNTLYGLRVYHPTQHYTYFVGLFQDTIESVHAEIAYKFYREQYPSCLLFFERLNTDQIKGLAG